GRRARFPGFFPFFTPFFIMRRFRKRVFSVRPGYFFAHRIRPFGIFRTTLCSRYGPPCSQKGVRAHNKIAEKQHGEHGPNVDVPRVSRRFDQLVLTITPVLTIFSSYCACAHTCRRACACVRVCAHACARTLYFLFLPSIVSIESTEEE